MPTSLERRHSRRRRHERTRQELIAAALDLAAEASFKDLTVDAITRSAGVSRSAFYVYFGDKEELLLGALEDVIADQQPRIGTCWQGEGEPAEQIAAALTQLARVYEQNAGLLGLAVEASTYDEEVRELWNALLDRFTQVAAAEIRDQQAAGGANPALSAGTVAENLVLMSERAFQAQLAGDGRSPEEVAAGLAEVWRAALYPG